MDYIFIPGERDTKTSSRYQLAVCAAQRARQIMEGDKPTFESRLAKPTTTAIEEILQGQLAFFYGKEAVRYQDEAARARRARRNRSLSPEREEELRKEIKKDLNVYLADVPHREESAQDDSKETDSE